MCYLFVDVKAKLTEIIIIIKNYVTIIIFINIIEQLWKKKKKVNNPY